MPRLRAADNITWSKDYLGWSCDRILYVVSYRNDKCCSKGSCSISYYGDRGGMSNEYFSSLIECNEFISEQFGDLELPSPC
jgi:hypothetical protein